MELSSKERAFMKKLAHGIDPVVRIGKDGIDKKYSRCRKKKRTDKSKNITEFSGRNR